MTEEIKQPTVSENDQGANADAQAGIVAHNDIAAATDDRTDAPRLDVDPNATEDAPPNPMSGAVTEPGDDGSSHNDALISQANEAPAAPAFSAVEPEAEAPTAAELYADLDDGVWQCQNQTCPSKDPDRAFLGPRQSVVQGTGVPLHCPNCDGATVLYIGEVEKKEVA